VPASQERLDAIRPHAPVAQAPAGSAAAADTAAAAALLPLRQLDWGSLAPGSIVEVALTGGQVRHVHC